MAALDFRKEFFEEIAKAQLGYLPWIAVAPSHMANGFFREIGGGYYNNEAQHRAIYAGVNPVPNAQDPFRKKFDSLPAQQQNALAFLLDHPQQRQILSQALRADKTTFKGVGMSSYTLSHAQHATNDNHDRGVGRWLRHILQQGEQRHAYELLHQLLTQGVTRSAETPAISDALSLMTLPLMNWDSDPKTRSYDYDLPANLNHDTNGNFADPLINTIRNTFDQLAENDSDSAKRNGKLDALRRMTTLACFAFYLHLINIGEPRPRKLPLLLYLDRNSHTLERASQESYRLVRQSTDNFVRDAISEKIWQLHTSGEFGPWDREADIEHHIDQTINWYRYTPGNAKEQSKVEELKRNCRNFYQSYLTTTPNDELRAIGPALPNNEMAAIALALADMVGLVFSETPASVARALGVKIGLLTRGDSHENKAYELHPDLLEVLVRAIIPVGEEWPLKKLAEYWYKQFGILFGGLGNENAKLAKWEITPVDVNELKQNRDALALQLEVSGYAQSYADGVVVVRVER